MGEAPLLEVVSVVRAYRLPRRSPFERRRYLRALHGVSLTMRTGTSVGLIGESGAGKSTLARLILALEEPDLGTVRLDGEDLFRATARRLKVLRRRMQMVFQDPYSSLDPHHPVGRVVAEPLIGLRGDLAAAERLDRVKQALEQVGLSPADAGRYPHEFSGGQRQRIAIARALVTEPALVVADEPVSALDVSVRAQVLNLMLDLQERRGLTYLFISHDLTVVRHVTGRVVVLYFGRIVEEGPTEEVFAAPAHPYTADLIAAAPRPDPARRRRPRAIEPDLPAPLFVRHCPYAGRCARARNHCRAEMPPLMEVAPGHRAACFYPLR